MGGNGRRTPELTRREREVVIELCRPSVANTGLAFTEPATVREIAERLFVSEAAVKQHLLRLYDKFEIPDGIACARATDYGWRSTPPMRRRAHASTVAGP